MDSDVIAQYKFFSAFIGKGAMLWNKGDSSIKAQSTFYSLPTGLAKWNQLINIYIHKCECLVRLGHVGYKFHVNILWQLWFRLTVEM